MKLFTGVLIILLFLFAWFMTGCKDLTCPTCPDPPDVNLECPAPIINCAAECPGGCEPDCPTPKPPPPNPKPKPKPPPPNPPPPNPCTGCGCPGQPPCPPPPDPEPEPDYFCHVSNKGNDKDKNIVEITMVGPIPPGHKKHFNDCPPDYLGPCDGRSYTDPCLGK